jgi:SNF2 family DNA or RNA helicase
VRRFQRGETDVLLAQIKTGGVGIDLFKSCIGIMHSMSYSSIDFDQAIKRLHRRGQTHPVKIFLPYVVDSVDEDIYDAVVLKRKVGELVLDRLKRRT